MYDSPIFYAKMNDQIDKEISDKCIKIALKYSIDIDEKKLIAALKADRRRYEEAYKRGYRDGRQAEIDENRLSQSMAMEDVCGM